MWEMFKEAVSSKKFVMTVAGTITGAALKLGLDLPTEAVATLLSPVVAYVLAQGWADRGATAAKVVAVAEASRGMASTGEAIENIKNA